MSSRNYCFKWSTGRKWPLSATRPLESSLYRLEKSRIFGWTRNRKWLQSSIPSLETSFFQLNHKSHFGLVKKQKMTSQSLANRLKHRFLEFTQAAFWGGQDTDNEFGVPGNDLKHRFLDFSQVAFCYGQDAENEFKVTCEPWNIAFSTSYKSRGRKFVRSALQSVEKLL